jgi:ATP-dependent DNA helicase RecG
MTFQPGTELVGDLVALRDVVDVCLSRLAAGELPSAVEREKVDLKEEAGRRGSGGVLLPAASTSTRAADHLADEVACMANTPGGGALIVGVDDRTGALIGTELDEEWLRQQIHRRIDVAPLVEARAERGIRLLVVLVPEAREPVPDTGDRLRWRVGPSCEAVDRGAWWLHRQGRAGWDPMARASRMSTQHVSPGAEVVARRYLSGRAVEDDLARAPLVELLRRIGLLTVDGLLTEAGALLFCPAPRAWVSWARFDVRGGEILASVDDFAGLSLLEQLARVEDLLEAANDRVTLAGTFAERSVRLLPPRSAREAVLNGIVHRDWGQGEATTVTWVEADSSLEVVSPGGFVGGVAPDNVLVQRFSRSPSLADAVRALGLVDKQGIGVDRMYREMVVLGHRPPLIREEPGPRVRVRLVGGRPVIPVMQLMGELEPTVRQRDVEVALIVHSLLHEPFLTPTGAASVLQRTTPEAREALETTAACVVRGEPIIVAYRDVWLLSQTGRDVVGQAGVDLPTLKRHGVLRHLNPDANEARTVVRSWLSEHDRMSSGDYGVLTGLTYAGARRVLERLVGEELLVRGEATGRNAHFRARRPPSRA